MRYESLPDVPHPENPEHEFLREAAESMVSESVEQLDIGLDLKKHPELRSRLAELGSHFEDSLAMARIIKEVYGGLKEALDLPDDGPERLMRAAILHDIGKSGPAGAEGDLHFAIRRLFITPLRRFNPYIDGRAKTIQEYMTEQEISKTETIRAALEDAGIDPAEETMIGFWRRHAEWTYGILNAAGGPDVDPDVINIASSHHLLEGQNPAHLELDTVPAGSHVLEVLEEAELLETVDKYQALRSRGGSGHEEAMEKLRVRIAERTSLPEGMRAKFQAVVDVLNRSKNALAPYFEKREGRG